METNSVLPPYWVSYQFELLKISEKSLATKRWSAKTESCSFSFRVAFVFIAWTVLSPAESLPYVCHAATTGGLRLFFGPSSVPLCGFIVTPYLRWIMLRGTSCCVVLLWRRTYGESCYVALACCVVLLWRRTYGESCYEALACLTTFNAQFFL